MLFCINQFGIKEFLKEISVLQVSEYNEIKEYLVNCPKTISLEIKDRQFELIHDIESIRPKNWTMHNVLLPQSKEKNKYFVYGHKPTPQLYQDIAWIGFEFDYRKIFTYVDSNANFYFNLDTGSNPIAALRLDDFSEYYVGHPGKRTNIETWKVHADVIKPITRYERYHYELTVGYNIFKIKNKSAMSKLGVYVSFQNNSYEYFFAVDYKMKRIFYLRISWLNAVNSVHVINDTAVKSKSIDDIIEMIRKQEETDKLDIADSVLYGYERL